MLIPAVVAAGDLRAAKAVYGESKVYLEMGGRPLVALVVEALQRVPEVGDIWVVGNAERLAGVFQREDVRSRLSRRPHVVPQFRSLYENAWQSYRRLLPQAGPGGRDPLEPDMDQSVLYLSGDLPFATPQEISQFVRAAGELGSSYALGLVTEQAMEDFGPGPAGEPGITPATFNLREGRFRQSNLHLVKPARIVNRFYIEEMYEHRYQREWGNIAALAWRLLRSEHGGLGVFWYYGLMHMAGVAHRRGWTAASDRIRHWIPMARIEQGVSSLLRASFRLVVTEVGGCAVDIDNESEYDAARARYDEWVAAQAQRAEQLHGPLPRLPAGLRAADDPTGRGGS